jgi:hypothetical protein
MTRFLWLVGGFIGLEVAYLLWWASALRPLG